MSLISENLKNIKSKLNKNVQLLAVSKTRSEDEILEAYNCGQKNFGENKVQDLFEKANNLSNQAINWHFIGHLQTNKINLLLKVSRLVSIHSVDSLKLLNKLLSKNMDKKIGIFLQVNTSNEVEKSGFTELLEIEEAINLIKPRDDFYLQGLMTIGRIRTDNFEDSARASFESLKFLKGKLDKDHSLDLELSMGMSQDFEIAQEIGTNWVRIGTDIFGKRP